MILHKCFFIYFCKKNKIMKKRILLCLLSLLVCTLNDAKTTETNNFLSYKNIIRVDLLIKYIDPSDELPKPSRTPIKGPSIGLCDNTLYLFGQFNNIVLRLVDNDIAIYSMEIPAGANEVELPADMQGIYELQLDDGKYIYYCEIEIE